jgi:hypothetical protein
MSLAHTERPSVCFALGSFGVNPPRERRTASCVCPRFLPPRADAHGRAAISSYWCFGPCINMANIRSHIPTLAHG